MKLILYSMFLMQASPQSPIPTPIPPPSPPIPTCPNNQIWTECGSACIRTCADPMPVCTEQCVQHCECPPQFPIFNNGVCISFKDCDTFFTKETSCASLKERYEELKCCT